MYYTYVCIYSNGTLDKKDLPMVTNPLNENGECEKADKSEGKISYYRKDTVCMMCHVEVDVGTSLKSQPLHPPGTYDKLESIQPLHPPGTYDKLGAVQQPLRKYDAYDKLPLARKVR